MRYLNYLLLAAILGALQGCPAVVATGVGTGALMAADRRTTGTYIEDEVIEDKANSQISTKYKNTAHVNITSFNRHVLITGEAPNEETRAGIAQIVAGVQNVKAVSNELVVSGLTGITSRSSDSIITGDVKLRFLNNKVFNADHVKVITENGTVFLMGLVYRKEAETATEIASTTSGVQRVVKVFEYLD
ncbi:MAG: BON domain-containing protein [Betaproteobacteria bacterium]|nr:BON domain-containing protein [Betaproteobacteria bacterium]